MVEEWEYDFILVYFRPIVLNANVLLINWFDVESLNEVLNLQTMVLIVCLHDVLYLKYLWFYGPRQSSNTELHILATWG